MVLFILKIFDIPVKVVCHFSNEIAASTLTIINISFPGINVFKDTHIHTDYSFFFVKETYN